MSEHKIAANIDLIHGRWERRRPLPIARSHCPVVEYQGKLYVFGGGSDNFASLNSTAIYDPAADTWSEGTPMPTRRSGTVPALVGDKIYIIAGGFKHEDGMFRFLRKVEIYCPQTDAWETGPDAIMPHDYPAVAQLGGKIYLMGGHHPEAYLAGPKTDPGFDFCERLDPAAGRWEQIAPLSRPRFALAGLAFHDKVLAMGGVAFTPDGFNNFTLIESYDPSADSWSTAADLTLPWPAAGLSACTFGENILIFGGYSGDGIHDRGACYDPKSRRWDLLPTMPEPRAATGIVRHGDTIYLIGGWADDGRTPQDSVFAYQIA